jgi:hypothetical protein
MRVCVRGIITIMTADKTRLRLDVVLIIYLRKIFVCTPRMGHGGYPRMRMQ